MRSLIATISCVAALALVDYSIVEKERLLESGSIVYLELAPVDPRSLMQGDYMALRFKMANDAAAALPRNSAPTGFFGTSQAVNSDGRIVAAVGTDRVASFRRLSQGEALAADEVLLQYRFREGQIKFATNAFFFQEGTANQYTGARYGEFRVGPDGGLLLTGLRDQTLKLLGPR